MHGPETRPTLIGKLANHACEQAWDEFTQIYRDIIYRVARARGLQDADAEDVTQEVFHIVSRKVESFDTNGKGSFRAWLHKLARDVAVDRLRKPRLDIGTGDSKVAFHLQQIPDAEETETLWDIEVKREQLLKACQRIRAQFSEPVWQSFWLTAIEQRPISEAAKLLGKTEGSVRVDRCRVMSRLKQEVLTNDRSFPL